MADRLRIETKGLTDQQLVGQARATLYALRRDAESNKGVRYLGRRLDRIDEVLVVLSARLSRARVEQLALKGLEQARQLDQQRRLDG